MRELIHQLGYAITLEEMQQTLKHYLSSPDYTVFVAEVDQQVIACAGLVIIRYLHLRANLAQLITLVVDNSLRNNKIGELLLQHVENYSREHGCVKIQLTSAMQRRESGAHSFYMKHGYQTDAMQYFVKEL